MIKLTRNSALAIALFAFAMVGCSKIDESAKTALINRTETLIVDWEHLLKETEVEGKANPHTKIHRIQSEGASLKTDTIDILKALMNNVQADRTAKKIAVLSTNYVKSEKDSPQTYRDAQRNLEFAKDLLARIEKL